MKSESKSGQASSPSPAIGANSALANKTTPKDVLIVNQILKDMGITDFEPRVVHQLIEFTYREFCGLTSDSSNACLSIQGMCRMS